MSMILRKRKVNRDLIDAFVDANYPNGVGKLSVKSGVPVSSINRIRAGLVPIKLGSRNKLANALGVSERVLFPIIEDGSGDFLKRMGG